MFCRLVKEAFDVSARCRENLITVIKRRSRKIVNVQKIGAGIGRLLRESHFTNTSVQVLDLALLSFQQQLQTVSR